MVAQPTGRAIGVPTPRVDGVEKATGRAVYTADVQLDGALFAKTLRSPFPHARILSIDTSKAEQMPGVHAVVTGADIYEGARHGRAVLDVPVLAQGIARFIGEQVAARGRGRRGHRTARTRPHRGGVRRVARRADDGRGEGGGRAARARGHAGGEGLPEGGNRAEQRLHRLGVGEGRRRGGHGGRRRDCGEHVHDAAPAPSVPGAAHLPRGGAPVRQGGRVGREQVTPPGQANGVYGVGVGRRGRGVQPRHHRGRLRRERLRDGYPHRVDAFHALRQAGEDRVRLLGRPHVG